MKHEHLPEGWRWARLREFLTYEPREIEVKPDETYYQIGLRSWGKGFFHKQPVLGKELGDKKLYLINDGDLGPSITFAWEGAIALASNLEDGKCASMRFPTFVVNGKIALGEYILRYFQTTNGVYELGLVSPGGAGRNRVLNKGQFLKIKIPLPPINEQRQIAEVLRDADANIARVEAQIEATQEVKRGVMQKYYSQAYDCDEVPNVRLKKLLKSVSRPETIVQDQLYKLCGVKWHAEGVHIHDELLGKEIKTGQLNRVACGDVMYNKMWASNRAFGIAKEEHDGAYVTSEYPQFTIRKDLLFPIYLEKFFYSYPCQTQAKIFSRGTTSRARVNPRDFLRIEIPLPSIDKQREIAAILSTHDATIRNFQAEAASLGEVKRGLMQGLLSGEVRA